MFKIFIIWLTFRQFSLLKFNINGTMKLKTRTNFPPVFFVTSQQLKEHFTLLIKSFQSKISVCSKIFHVMLTLQNKQKIYFVSHISSVTTGFWETFYLVEVATFYFYFNSKSYFWRLKRPCRKRDEHNMWLWEVAYVFVTLPVINFQSNFKGLGDFLSKERPTQKAFKS